MEKTIRNPLLRPQRDAAVAYRIFGSDAVLISTDSNLVRLLNPTGSFVWHLCDGTRSVQELVAYLTHLYALAETEAENALLNFLNELHERKLICWLGPPTAPSDST